MASSSLRFRLTVWYASALAVTLSIFCVFLLLTLSYQLRRHHDHGLVATCHEVAARVREAGSCSDAGDLHRTGHHGGTAPQVEVAPLEGQAAASVPTDGEVLLATREGSGGHLRVASCAVH